MRTIWRSLLWREWHEHKWKLAALSTIMLSLQIAIVWADPQFVSVGSPIAALFAIAPLAVFVGMAGAAGERADGTIAFVRGLPARRWQLAAVRLVAGAATLLLSLVLAMLVPLAWLVVLQCLSNEGHESPFEGLGAFEAIAYSGLLAAGTALSCFVWTMAFGVNKATEIRAGLAGAAILFVAFVCRIQIEYQRLPVRSDPTVAMQLVRCCDEIGPLGLTRLFHPVESPRRLDPFASPWRVVALQLAAFVSLVGWTLLRYGEAATGGKSSAAAVAPTRDERRASRRRTIRPAWRTTLAAVAWKQAREAAPFCVLGVALAVGMSLWLALMDSGNGTSAEHLAAAGVAVGMLTALLVGIGTFVGELQGRVLEFWRSRPIEPALWFWTKYLTGFAAVALLLAAPIACGGARGFVVILVSLPWLAIVYSLAVCLTCWVRHSFYAGVLGFTLPLYLAWLSAWLERRFGLVSFVGALRRASGLGFGDWLIQVYLPFLLVTMSLAAALTIAAWLAVKRDLGPHRIAGASRALHLSS
jgi:hypothetical protein